MRVDRTAGNESKGLECQERAFFSGLPSAELKNITVKLVLMQMLNETETQIC